MTSFDTHTQIQHYYSMLCHRKNAPTTSLLLVLVLLIEPFLSSAPLNSVCFAQRRKRKGGRSRLISDENKTAQPSSDRYCACACK